MTGSAEQRTLGFLLGIALLFFAFTQAASVTALRSITGQSGSTVTTVSAASFAPAVAPDSIAAAFGSRLATRTEAAASQPLPTSLAGTRVRVNGALAPLFFVSPTQVNYVIPTGTASGAASVVVTSGDGTVSTGTAQVSVVTPAVFSASASGAGVPAAVLARLKTDGTQVFEPVAQFDPASNLFVPRPISFGASGERLFLILYLCGIRNAPDADGNPGNGVAESIRVMFGGAAFAPIFAGASPGFTGLDQINVELTRSLSGRVSAQVEFGSVTSNITEVEVAAPGRTATTLALSSSASASVYGQAVTFTAQVNTAGGAAAGTVIFRDGATTLGARSLEAGRAAITVSTLAVGSHQITAHYGGDNSFSGSWAKFGNQNVSKASTALNLSSSANPSVANQPVTFTAQVNAVAPGGGTPAGRVMFTDDGVMIGHLPLDTSGRAAITVQLAPAGPHSIAASYEGDGNLNASTGTLGGGQNVNKAQASVVVTSSANPAGKDQTLTLTATVTANPPAVGAPTGSVQFKGDAANIGAPITLINGRASIETSSLALGAHAITAEYYGDPSFQSSVSAAFSQSINTPPLQVGGIIRPQVVYAGDEITIQGSGFSGDPSAHEVQVIDDDGSRTTAKVETAAPDQLKVRIPFGAGSGRVKVILQQRESESLDRLPLTTSVSGFVQEAVRQPDGSVVRSPIQGVTLRAFGAAGLIASAATNADGSFVVKFPAGAVFGNTIDLEIDGGSVPGPLPYPNQKRKMRVRPNRDNQYNGDTDASGNLLANIIELKRAGTATTGSLASNSPASERLSAPAPASPEETRDSITSGNVTFDTNNSAITCPGGAGNCNLTLTVLDAGRTPANLPAGYFSSTIAQITPFGATLAPGGKLTFPNSDGIPTGMPVRVFRFDQTLNGQNLGRFVDIGAATISADGTKIETTANAVTQTSYYFVSRQWPMATIIGHVVETDGRPVRRAVVNTRGQSAFTDNNGGFVLANVPVITPDGFNDQVVVEISFARPDGRVDRAQRGVLISANASVTIDQDFVLPRPIVNRQPVILAPPSLVVTEGETRNFNFVMIDPDGQPLTVNLSGAPFASLSGAGNNVYTLRLSPGANSAGNYALTITASDSQGLMSMQNLAVTVRQANNNAPTAHYLTVSTDEDIATRLTLSVSNPGDGALSYNYLSLPAHGSLGGVAPNLTYIPETNYNGLDSFSFKVNDGVRESNVATVFVVVNPVNDAPVLVVQGPQVVNAGQTLDLAISGIDLDVGQTLSFTTSKLPPGATIIPITLSSVRFTWTPTFTQIGVYSLGFTASDDGSPVLSDTKGFTIEVDAKWAKTSGIERGNIAAFAADGSHLFAGTEGAGIFHSTDNGQSWVAVNSGLPSNSIKALAVSGTHLFAAVTNNGIYRSSNKGQSWAAANTGLTNLTIFSFAASGANVFAGSYGGGVYRSTNNGENWTQVNSGLTNRFVTTLAAKGGDLFAGTQGGGVYRSTNNGTSWTPVNLGLTDLNVNALAAGGSSVFAGTTDSGVYRSTNNGQSWVPVVNLPRDNGVLSLAASGTNIFVGMNFISASRGVYRSTDDGQSWTLINSGIENLFVYAFAISGANIFAGTYGGGVYRLAENGQNWAPANAGLSAADIYSLAVNGTTIFAGTYNGTVYRSTDEGQSWTTVASLPPTLSITLAVVGPYLFAGIGNGVYRSINNGASWALLNSGLPTYPNVQAFAISGSNLFVGTFGHGVYRSNNNGISWTAAGNGLTDAYLTSLAVSGTTLFAGTYRGGVFRSIDNGQNWAAVNTGLTNCCLNNIYIRSLTVVGTTIFVGTNDGGVYRSTDNGQSWSAVNDGLPRYSTALAFAVSGSHLFVGGNRVFLLTNNGTSWIRIDSDLGNPVILSLAVSGTNIFAGTAGGGVSRLTNNVQSWTAANNHLTNLFVNSVTVSGTRLFVGTSGGGVFRSNDQGQSWTAVNAGLPASANGLSIANVQALVARGTNLFAGTFGNGIFRSINDGNNWTEANNGLANRHVNALRTQAGILFAATDAGVFRSANDGASWVASGLGNLRVVSLATRGSNLLAGTDGGGVYVSSNNGESWTAINRGMANLFITALTVGADGATLFAGTDGGGIYRSTDGGANWAAVNNDLPPTLNVYSFAVSGNKLYAGSIYGVFLSEDNGAKWKQINAGLLDIYVTSLAVNGKTLIAGTRVGGVFSSQIP